MLLKFETIGKVVVVKYSTFYLFGKRLVIWRLRYNTAEVLEKAIVSIDIGYYQKKIFYVLHKKLFHVFRKIH